MQQETEIVLSSISPLLLLDFFILVFIVVWGEGVKLLVGDDEFLLTLDSK